MYKLYYYQEVLSDNPDKIRDTGLCIFDTKSGEICDYIASGKHSCIPKLIRNSPDVVLERYSQCEENNPEYDSDEADRCDREEESYEISMIIEYEINVNLFSIYENLLNKLVLSDELLYALYRACKTRKLDHLSRQIEKKALEYRTKRDEDNGLSWTRPTNPVRTEPEYSIANAVIPRRTS